MKKLTSFGSSVVSFSVMAVCIVLIIDVFVTDKKPMIAKLIELFINLF